MRRDLALVVLTLVGLVLVYAGMHHAAEHKPPPPQHHTISRPVDPVTGIKLGPLTYLMRHTEYYQEQAKFRLLLSHHHRPAH
jgi:hypothetical protein